jgi:hypothetical protein
MSSYRIVDEPTPSGLERWAVRPFWPLLAQMLAGAWLAWPWFVLNSIALGSASRRREQAWVAAAVIGSSLVAGVVMWMLESRMMSVDVARYVAIALVALKLGVASWLHALQQRTVGLFEHFGGTVRNGVGLVVVGAIVRSTLLPELPLFLALVLS